MAAGFSILLTADGFDLSLAFKNAYNKDSERGLMGEGGGGGGAPI